MKKIFKNIFLLLASASLFVSCESTDLELQNNPLTLTPVSANPDFILNSMLLSSGGQHITLSGLTDGAVRHIAQFGAYQNNIAGLTQDSMNGPWQSTYQLMSNMALLTDLANQNNLPHHTGMAKIMNAFQLINLVDYMGTATYSEAVNPDQFPTPGLDSGESIYAEMITLLEDGMSDLNQTAAYTHVDGFFNGDLDSWRKLANSLIIRMYVQSRKATSFNATEAASRINAIVSSGMYIASPADDFQILFTGNINNPDTRHPSYLGNYLGAAGTYMSNEFMSKLLFDWSVEDPRLKHYIYRQNALAPNDPQQDQNYISDCIAPANNTCYVGFGYWGRMHADDRGVVNDGAFRSTYGAYPAGGAFDNDTFVQDNYPINAEGTPEFDTYGPRGNGILDDFASVGQDTGQNSGAGGVGIYPVLTSSTMNFLLAEAVLFIPGVTGSDATYFNQGMQDSFNKVSDFTGETMDNLATYMAEVNAAYAAAASDEGKLEVIINQLYVASFGSSVDMYNAYRRTGYPNFADEFDPFTAPGAFPRSMFLPNSEIISNDNPDFTQKQLTDQVFWDTNPAGFIE